MKRIITLVAALAVAATTFAVVAYGSSTRATATTVKVGAKEFKFTMSRKSAPHGKITFKIKNNGTIKHDFKIAGKKSKMLSPGKSTILTVTLKKGKKYTYICTVPGHAAAGMKGTFKAT